MHHELVLCHSCNPNLVFDVVLWSSLCDPSFVWWVGIHKKQKLCCLHANLASKHSPVCKMLSCWSCKKNCWGQRNDGDNWGFLLKNMRIKCAICQLFLSSLITMSFLSQIARNFWRGAPKKMLYLKRLNSMWLLLEIESENKLSAIVDSSYEIHNSTENTLTDDLFEAQVWIGNPPLISKSARMIHVIILHALKSRATWWWICLWFVKWWWFRRWNFRKGECISLKSLLKGI